MSDNNSSWEEYGRLVLKELERLNENYENLRTDVEKRFNELNLKMTEFNATEKDVEELKEWKEKVTEVWSSSQMKQSKDELYEQKNQWQKAIGIMVAVQVIFGILIAFKDELF